MYKLKKSISLLLTVLILFLYAAYPVISYAQEVTPIDTPTPTVDQPIPTDIPTVDPSPTDTPTPTPTPIIIDNSSSVSNNTAAVSDTGDINVDANPTPTPIVDPAVSPSPDSSDALGATDSSNQLDPADSTPSGTEDPTSTNSPDQSSTTTITTGDAVSNTAIENNVNTTCVNSTVVNQTINIFVTQNGDINLSDPYTIAASAIQDHPDDPVINVSAVNVNNFAYLDNNAVSFASSGNNSINSIGDAIINTGNAYSAVSILNKVNFTIINSEVHLVTINLFGQLNGNIILPNLNPFSSCTNCGASLDADNQASVTNNVDSVANSGKDQITASSEAGLIVTGDAKSAVNVLNIVNTDLNGVDARVLYINNLGNWNGDYIGWDNNILGDNGSGLVLFSLGTNQTTCSNCGTSADIHNTAIVKNNVLSFADSGNNSITGGNGAITTGTALSAVSLLNFVNSTFINSFGFFGFINIFGNWNGSIGGANEFAALNAPDNSPSLANTNQTSSNPTQEQGGQLNVENKNNVGAYVYPGDTVTFFINVGNPGTGKVYGTKLVLYLIKNGVLVGKANYDLGDIPGGQSIGVTTGIALPKNTSPGLYTARAIATGNVGPDNSSVSASSDSLFTVFGNSLAILTNSKSNSPKVAVLGAQNGLTDRSSAQRAQATPFLMLLIALIFSYVVIRLLRKTNYIFIILSSRTFKEKVYFLKMLLL